MERLPAIHMCADVSYVIRICRPLVFDVSHPTSCASFSNKTHHQCFDWALLSDEPGKTHFGAIIAGAKSIMGAATDELIDGQVLYHEHEERVDFFFQRRT